MLDGDALMIVPQREIELVEQGRRRQMWLPADRGELGELITAPFDVGDVLRLQVRAFVKGVAVTVVHVELGQLGTMSDTDARNLGYQTVRAAKHAWAAQHGPTVERQVWIVRFVRGNHAAFYNAHRERYLKAKGVGLTTDPAKAVRGEPAVTTGEQLELARRARERRELEERQGLVDLARQMEAMRRSTDDELRKRMLKRSIRNIQALLKVPSDANINSRALQQLGSDAPTSRPPDGIAPPSPETAAA